MAAALFLRHREPGIADFAEAVQLPLEFRVFPLDHFPVGVRGNINRRSHQNDRARKWQGQLKMIPGFLKCAGSLQPDIKGDNRTSGAARQHDGAGLATKRGPRGPSTVKATSRPSSRRCSITARPRKPPRVVLPCATPKPIHWATAPAHRPSKFALCRITTP